MEQKEYIFADATDHEGNRKPERIGRTCTEPVFLNDRSFYCEYTGNRAGKSFKSSYVLECTWNPSGVYKFTTLNSIYVLMPLELYLQQGIWEPEAVSDPSEDLSVPPADMMPPGIR